MKKILTLIAAAALCLTAFTSCSSSNDARNAKIEGNVDDVQLKAGDKYAVISIEDYGDITVKLFEDAAPIGVQNFIDLANSGFYTGKNFHRIIAGFMAQGGSETGNGTAATDSTLKEFGIETNYSARHFYGALCYANSMATNTSQFYIVNNKTGTDINKYDLETINANAKSAQTAADKYEEGSIYKKYYQAQANTYKYLADFITNATDEVIEKYKKVGGTPSLDGGYTVFGQTVDGFDVLDAISAVEVTAQSDSNTEKSKPVTEVIISSVTIKTYGE